MQLYRVETIIAALAINHMTAIGLVVDRTPNSVCSHCSRISWSTVESRRQVEADQNSDLPVGSHVDTIEDFQQCSFGGVLSCIGIR